MSDELFSIVIPCYNEGELAFRNTREVLRYLRSKDWNFELMICDDASDNHTSEILQKLQDERIQIFRYERGPSRRENMAETLKKANGEILVYMDMDLSTSLEDLDRLISCIQTGDYDVVIGSRWVKGSVVNREWLRYLYSFMYNWVVRLLFGSVIRDHQCGFKAFRRKAYLQLANEMGYDENFNRGWFWDAEMLIRAQKRKARILEIPVHWMAGYQSSFDFFRELKVIPYMIRAKRTLYNEDDLKT